MPQVANLYTLVLAVALIAAGVALLLTGNTAWGALCLGAVLGNTAPSPLKTP